MAVSWEVLAPTVGGVLAALAGGTLGGWLGHRSQRTHWTRDSRLSAYTELMRCYAEAYHILSQEPSDHGRAKVDWSEWNRALAVVNLIAATPVAAQAVKIDEMMWRLSLAAERGYIERWTQVRKPLEQAVLEFVNLARGDVGGFDGPVARLNGRPDPGDPIWRARQAQ